MYLAEIGARLSDVFGADNILWVEGQTEEECFPLILRGIAGRPLMGTIVAGIRQTGDLEGRDAKRVFELYNRLSSTSTLLPSAIGFILDRECRSSVDIKEIQNLSRNLTIFLPRRMYENYLLNARAIAAVTNGAQGFRSGKGVTEAEVQTLIDKKRQEAAFYCKGAVAEPSEWIRHIDGAKLLREIFQELSETRVEFKKTRHSIDLTKWLIANEPAELGEVAEILATALSRSQAKPVA